MKRSLGFWYRIIAISFAFFLTSLISFVLILVRWRNLDLNFQYSKILRALVGPLTGIHVRIEGREHLLGASPPCVFVSNHQSNLDTIMLAEIFPRRCLLIGKKELLYVPFFGLFFYGAGNILIDRSRRKQAITSLDKAVITMKERQASIWIFPEGTRNEAKSGLLPFKKGAFYMAVQAGVPLVPVVSGPMKERFDWKRRVLSPGTHVVRVLPPVSTQGLDLGDVDALVQRVHAQMLQAAKSLSDDLIRSEDCPGGLRPRTKG